MIKKADFEEEFPDFQKNMGGPVTITRNDKEPALIVSDGLNKSKLYDITFKARQWQVSFPGGSEVKYPPASEGNVSLIPGSGRPPGGGNGYQFPFLPGKSHGQRCPMGYSLQKHRIWHDWVTEHNKPETSHTPESAPIGSINVLATTVLKPSHSPAYTRYASIYIWITQVIKQMLTHFYLSKPTSLLITHFSETHMKSIPWPAWTDSSYKHSFLWLWHVKKFNFFGWWPTSLKIWKKKKSHW